MNNTYLASGERSMPFTEFIRPLFTSLPPIYVWPTPLKRLILALAIIICIGAYVLLIGGLLGVGAILLEVILN